MSTHLTHDENMQDLVGRMADPEDVLDYTGFRNSRVEACFEGRYFVVYRPQGLNANNTHREPEVITTLKISDFYCDGKLGPQCTVTDLSTDETQILTTVPARLFNYQIFANIPIHSRIRWEARLAGSEVRRYMIFGLVLKTRNRSDHYTMGNTYCENPNQFRSLYPDSKFQPLDMK